MPKDLAAIKLGELIWDESSRGASITVVYDHATAGAQSAIDWYQVSRKPKKRAAMFLRWSAVVLLSASGLIPLASTLMDSSDNGPPLIDPLYTSLAVALAAALFGFDKLFNYSTGWMRYVRADLSLRTALSEFEIEWQIARAAWPTANPTVEQAAEMLGRCKTFTAQVNGIVAEETNLWITEFQATLAQLGESVKAAEARVEADTARRAEAAAQKGALNVTVKHDGQTYAGQFRLRVDNDQQGKVYVGPNVALIDLPAGPHKLAAEYSVGGKVHRGEFSVDVVPGKTLEASVPVAAAE